MLFEAGVRINKMKTCTSVPCKWVLPTPVTSVPYQELRDIDFSSSKSKKKKLDEQIHLSSNRKETVTTNTATSTSYVPTQIQVKKFFERLHTSNTRPAILSLTPPYNQDYIPKTDTCKLPEPLTQLYSDEHCSLDYQGLLAKSKEVFQNIQVTDQQAKSIEEATRCQSKSHLWFQMRAGRITTSTFQQAKLSSPSVSQVKNVCYGSSFTSEATTWGCVQEKQVLQQYQQVIFFLSKFNQDL